MVADTSGTNCTVSGVLKNREFPENSKISDSFHSDHSDYSTASEDYCSELVNSDFDTDSLISELSHCEFEDSDLDSDPEDEENGDFDEIEAQKSGKSLEKIQEEFDELLKKFADGLDKFEEEMEELKQIF